MAVLLVTSSVALLYYTKYQQEVTNNENYIGDLDSALNSYRSLSNSFNASLQDYNETLSLLTSAVADLNTSTPAYGDASIALATLWKDYQALDSASGRRAIVYEVNMLLDFGNGTRRWYNDTSIQPGWNGYVVTLVLLDGRVQATWYPQYGEHYVTGLGGVSDTQSDYWFLLTYNKTASWQVAQLGADDISMFNDTTIGWVYCPENSNYAPTCALP